MVRHQGPSFSSEVRRLLVRGSGNPVGIAVRTRLRAADEPALARRQTHYLVRKAPWAAQGGLCGTRHGNHHLRAVFVFLTYASWVLRSVGLGYSNSKRISSLAPAPERAGRRNTADSARRTVARAFNNITHLLV